MSTNPNIPPSVQRLLDMMHSSLPESIKLETTWTFCDEVRVLYEERVSGVEKSAFAPDRDFHSDEVEFLLTCSRMCYIKRHS
ncbi:hypothetical protein BD413DRAFT_609219 [Trametes elegans]|nr:hypothetical protein BD413DRAFT_609219 [Trametes elegans]